MAKENTSKSKGSDISKKVAKSRMMEISNLKKKELVERAKKFSAAILRG